MLKKIDSVLFKEKILFITFEIIYKWFVFVYSKMNLFDSNLIYQNKNNLKSLFFKIKFKE